eukprot:2089825-Pyramimonas_sp.AAC.1
MMRRLKMWTCCSPRLADSWCVALLALQKSGSKCCAVQRSVEPAVAMGDIVSIVGRGMGDGGHLIMVVNVGEVAFGVAGALFLGVVGCCCAG